MMQLLLNRNRKWSTTRRKAGRNLLRHASPTPQIWKHSQRTANSQGDLSQVGHVTLRIIKENAQENFHVLEISRFSHRVEALVTRENALAEVLAFGVKDACQLMSIGAVSECANVHLKSLYHPL